MKLVDDRYIKCTRLKAVITATCCSNYRNKKAYPGCAECSALDEKESVDMARRLEVEPACASTQRTLNIIPEPASRHRYHMRPRNYDGRQGLNYE